MKNNTWQNLHTLQSAAILFISLPLSHTNSHYLSPYLLLCFLLEMHFAGNCYLFRKHFATIDIESPWLPPYAAAAEAPAPVHNVISQIELSVAHFDFHSNEYSSFHIHTMHHSILDDKYNRKSYKPSPIWSVINFCKSMLELAQASKRSN